MMEMRLDIRSILRKLGEYGSVTVHLNKAGFPELDHKITVSWNDLSNPERHGGIIIQVETPRDRLSKS